MCSTLPSRSALVSPAALSSLLASPNPPLLLDASWHMPSSSRSAAGEYRDAHLPGALRFDMDAPGIADTSSSLPHMLDRSGSGLPGPLRTASPPPVVVYAQGDPPSSAFIGASRAWWHLRVLGFKDVRILDGGLRAAREAGLPIESGPEPEGAAGDASWTPHVVESLVWDMKTVTANAAEGKAGVTLLDARGETRFRGLDPEPRPGLRAGHVAGSLNVPFTECVDTVSGKLKPREALLDVFRARGVSIDSTQRFATTCGSGVTATITALALHEVGIEHVPVYDASWSEFGQTVFKDNPVQTG